MKNYCLLLFNGNYVGKNFLIKSSQKRRRFQYLIEGNNFYIIIKKEKHEAEIKHFKLDSNDK